MDRLCLCEERAARTMVVVFSLANEAHRSHASKFLGRLLNEHGGEIHLKELDKAYMKRYFIGLKRLDILPDVVRLPPFCDVMEVANGCLRLLAPQAQAPQAPTVKMLSLDVEADWSEACQKLENLLMARSGGEIRLVELNVAYMQRYKASLKQQRVLPEVVQQPPFSGVMEVSDGFLRLLAPPPRLPPVPQAQAPQARTKKRLSLAVKSDWPSVCRRLEEVLEGVGGAIPFQQLNTAYIQQHGPTCSGLKVKKLPGIIAQPPFCDIMYVADGCLRLLAPKAQPEAFGTSLAAALGRLEVKEEYDSAPPTPLDDANPQQSPFALKAAEMKTTVSDIAQLTFLDDSLVEPRAPGRDFVALYVTKDGKEIDLAFSMAPPEAPVGFERLAAEPQVSVFSLSASFLRRSADARTFLRGLLADPYEAKVTFDCSRMAPLLDLLAMDGGGDEDVEEEEAENEVAWLAAAARAPLRFTGLIDLQLAADLEGGPSSTLAQCVASVGRADWATALGKTKSSPAALLRGGEALQGRAGWGALDSSYDRSTPPALALVRKATALRLAMVRRAARQESAYAAGTRPLLFDPQQKRLVSVELALMGGGPVALEGTALVVNEDVQSLYGIVSLRLFESEPLEGADQPESWAQGASIHWRDPAVAHRLIEIVLDLGKRPRAKLRGERQPVYLHRDPTVLVEAQDLESLMFQVGDSMGHDHRAGINGTLHRISIIKGREESQVLGATLRCGRHVTGNIEPIRDLLDENPDKMPSILVVGPPGTGKTTIIRELARVLSTDLCIETLIIDTSNEIAGDGMTAHDCVGNARRMMVRSRDHQADVMIEGVQNHTPELMIIDEIGRSKECQAALTCKERGVAMIGSAHGSFFSLLRNKDLRLMMGGINISTVSDRKAESDNHGSKTLVERTHAPVFDIIIELRRGHPHEFTIYRNVGDTIDAIYKKKPFSAERRVRHPDSAGLVYVSRVASKELRREQAPLMGEVDFEMEEDE